MFPHSSELLFLMPFAAALLVLMARLDIYFSIRHKRIADSRYLAELRSFYEQPRHPAEHAN
jgi:hypothetical protein